MSFAGDRSDAKVLWKVEATGTTGSPASPRHALVDLSRSLPSPPSLQPEQDEALAQQTLTPRLPGAYPGVGRVVSYKSSPYIKDFVPGPPVTSHVLHGRALPGLSRCRSEEHLSSKLIAHRNSNNKVEPLLLPSASPPLALGPSDSEAPSVSNNSSNTNNLNNDNTNNSPSFPLSPRTVPASPRPTPSSPRFNLSNNTNNNSTHNINSANDNRIHTRSSMLATTGSVQKSLSSSSSAAPTRPTMIVAQTKQRPLSYNAAQHHGLVMKQQLSNSPQFQRRRQDLNPNTAHSPLNSNLSNSKISSHPSHSLTNNITTSHDNVFVRSKDDSMLSATPRGSFNTHKVLDLTAVRDDKEKEPKTSRASISGRERSHAVSIPGNGYELLLKACNGALRSEIDRQYLYCELVSLSREEVVGRLSHAYHVVHMHHQLRRKSSGPGKKHKAAGTFKNLVELQPFHLDFGMEGGHGLQCSTTVEDTLELTNNHKSNIPFSISVWSASSQAKITCEPMSGTIKKKSTTTVKLTLTTTASKVGIIRAVVAVQFGELGQFFSLIHLKASCICFGVNPEELDIVSDGEHNVPEVLVILKNCLRENGGFHQEGIFRLAGDELETADVKRRLNLGTFTCCQDMNCIATLIKVWFRELPRQVLGTVDTNALCEGCSECLMEERKVVEALPEMERTLFMWLVDLCIEVALLQRENKMTVRNLAIVLAPNLATPSPGDALQSLSGLGKLVGFVRTIILSRVQEKKAMGLLCDPDLDWES